MKQYYTGLDVSLEETAICTVDEKGVIAFEETVPTKPKLIDMCLKAKGLPIEKISLESGSLSHWLVKELKSFGWTVVCIDARSISAVLALNTNKTDRNDARGIAEALRSQCKYSREVYHQSQGSIELGTLLGARRTLVEQRTATNNTIRGLLKAYGICLGVGGNEKIAQSVRDKIINQQEVTKQGIKPLLVIFQTLNKEIEKMEENLLKIAKKDSVVKRLMTVPGVGPITALTYKITIDNPSRFKQPKTVGAYLGMTPKQYSSGLTKRQGRISKRGSKELRTLLAGAGLSLLMRCKKESSLRTWGLKIKERHGDKKACMAIGRKMAIIMHRIWINNTVFDPGISKETSNK